MSNLPRVTELWIYPIKSCRGISVSSLEIDQFGPRYDRQWMIVDCENKFITLRNQSRLAFIKTEIDSENLYLKFDSSSGPKKLAVSLTKESSIVESVTVWADTFLAGVESDDVNLALSDFLEQKVKLVRYQKESFRDLKTAATALVRQTRFADSRPLLLTNENSLADLNEKLAAVNVAPSQMERFRSNIIINGFPAFTEDTQTRLLIGSVKLVNPKLCSRCVVINQDQNTGAVVSKETLATLAGYRRIGGNKVMFGINWTPECAGVMTVGDYVDSLVSSID